VPTCATRYWREMDQGLRLALRLGCLCNLSLTIDICIAGISERYRLSVGIKAPVVLLSGFKWLLHAVTSFWRYFFDSVRRFINNKRQSPIPNVKCFNCSGQYSVMWIERQFEFVLLFSFFARSTSSGGGVAANSSNVLALLFFASSSDFSLILRQAKEQRWFL